MSHFWHSAKKSVTWKKRTIYRMNLPDIFQKRTRKFPNCFLSPVFSYRTLVFKEVSIPLPLHFKWNLPKFPWGVNLPVTHCTLLLESVPSRNADWTPLLIQNRMDAVWCVEGVGAYHPAATVGGTQIPRTGITRKPTKSWTWLSN